MADFGFFEGVEGGGIGSDVDWGIIVDAGRERMEMVRRFKGATEGGVRNFSFCRVE